MRTSSKLTSIAYFILAAAFVAAIPFAPYPGSWLLKAAPILVLAHFQWRRSKKPSDRLLLIGLLLSALGDVLLNISSQLFVGGLVSFLMAYALYAFAFYQKREPTPFRIGISVAEGWYSIALLWLLLPSLGSMTVPVIAYMTVITTMAALAILRGDKHYYVGLGALILMASDTLLAVNHFVVPIPYGEFPEMITYYLGQYLIVYGCSR